MHHFFPHRMFNFEALRLLSTAPYGGCEICEFLEAVSEIQQNNPESWHRAWLSQAQKAEAIGDEAAANGIRFAACNAYLRSMNYYRASQFMFNDRPEALEPRCLPISEKSIAMFRAAIPFMETEVMTFSIPHEDLMLPAYLYLPSAEQRRPQGAKCPILITIGGADVTQEELYFLYPAVGPRHGYAVLTFEGPGQGIVLRKDRRPMVPDFERVTIDVINHIHTLAAQQPNLNLDLDRIIMTGATFGGYYALRAAAADSRIKACISIDPFYSMYDLAATRIPPLYLWAWEHGWVPDAVFDALGNVAAALHFPTRWEFHIALWMFGLGRTSWADAIREMKRYTLRLKGGKRGDDDYVLLLHKIKCATMVTGAGHALYATPDMSTHRIMEELVNVPERRKRVWIATEPAEGGLQAKLGAWDILRQKSFEFLDEVLEY